VIDLIIVVLIEEALGIVILGLGEVEASFFHGPLELIAIEIPTLVLIGTPKNAGKVVDAMITSLYKLSLDLLQHLDRWLARQFKGYILILSHTRPHRGKQSTELIIT